MPTKFFTLLSLYCLWFILTGFAVSDSSILFSVITPAIAYLLSVKLINKTEGMLAKRRLQLKETLLFTLYFFWLIKEILKSSLAVIKIIWSRKLKIDSTFEWIDCQKTESKTKLGTELMVILQANSITLTPGTVTLDVKNDMILVHALNQVSIDELKNANFPMFSTIKLVA